MSSPKIVIMGGGGITFTPLLLVDFAHCTELEAAEIALVDIREEPLKKNAALARRLFETAGRNYTVTETTERAEALPNADYVIITVEVERFPTWTLDYAIPQQFGIEQALGENGGPGGLSHALRIVPVVVDICQDVDRLCPDAFVINLTNPLSRVSKGIQRYSDVNFVSLCHEIKAGREHLEHVLERPEEGLDVVAAGLNHFTWFLDITDGKTGDDLYPAVREAYPKKVTFDRLLTADIFRQTGVLCVTSDSHCGEYIPGGHVWKTKWAEDMEPMPFKVDLVQQIAKHQEWEMGHVLDGKTPAEKFMHQTSGEDIVDLLCSHWYDRGEHYDAINVPNKGFIPNLPDDAIVEVPGTVDRRGGHGDTVAPLPEPIATWCLPQLTIHELTAKAAVEGDRAAALDALMVDPTMSSVQQSGDCLDALLAAHREYLPRFFD